MNLTEAIAMKLFQRRYIMAWTVVALLPAPELIAGAEIIITALAGGYVSTGTGFAHHSAGESTASHELSKEGSRTTGIDPETWHQHFKWVMKNTAFIANTRIQGNYFDDRVDTYKANLNAIDGLEQELERIEDRQQEVRNQRYDLAMADLAWWEAFDHDHLPELQTAVDNLATTADKIKASGQSESQSDETQSDSDSDETRLLTGPKPA